MHTQNMMDFFFFFFLFSLSQPVTLLGSVIMDLKHVGGGYFKISLQKLFLGKIAFFFFLLITFFASSILVPRKPRTC